LQDQGQCGLHSEFRLISSLKERKEEIKKKRKEGKGRKEG
jgi:hypothetical protein